MRPVPAAADSAALRAKPRSRVANRGAILRAALRSAPPRKDERETILCPDRHRHRRGRRRRDRHRRHDVRRRRRSRRSRGGAPATGVAPLGASQRRRRRASPTAAPSAEPSALGTHRPSREAARRRPCRRATCCSTWATRTSSASACSRPNAPTARPSRRSRTTRRPGRPGHGLARPRRRKRAETALHAVLKAHPDDQEAHYDLGHHLLLVRTWARPRRSGRRPRRSIPTSTTGRRSQSFVDLLEDQETRRRRRTKSDGRRRAGVRGAVRRTATGPLTPPWRRGCRACAPARSG